MRDYYEEIERIIIVVVVESFSTSKSQTILVPKKLHLQFVSVFILIFRYFSSLNNKKGKLRTPQQETAKEYIKTTILMPGCDVSYLIKFTFKSTFCCGRRCV